MSSTLKTFSTLSLIFGIFSLIAFCIPVLSVFIAFVGFVFGVIVIVKTAQSEEANGKAIAGTIISGIALLIGIFVNVFVFNFSNRDNIFKFFNKNDTTQNYYFPKINNDVDTNYIDIDSLIMDNDQINNLDNSMTDTSNGPGSAP